MRCFEPSDVWSIKGVSDLDLSPDGTQIAFVVSSPSAESDSLSTSIYVASTLDGRVSQFSYGPKDLFPRWSPDGKYLAYLQTDGGDAQIALASLSGGEPKTVTSAAGGITYFSWSPDGSKVAYVSKVGDQKDEINKSAIEKSAPMVLSELYNRFDNIGRFDGRRSHVFVLDLSRGGELTALTEGDWDDFEPVWSPDGTQIAFTADRSATRGKYQSRDLWVVDSAGQDAPRRLTKEIGTAVGPMFSPDGRYISFVGHENLPGDSSKNTHLMLVSSDGSTDPRTLTQALDRPVWGVQPALGRSHCWINSGNDILFLANDSGRQGIYRVSVTDAHLETHRVYFSDLQVMTVCANEGTIFFVGVWPSVFTEVRTCSIDGSNERQLTNINQTIAEEVELKELNEISYLAKDGQKIDSFVLYPTGFKVGEPAPAVLEIHGGPHGWHPQTSMMPLYQSLVANGYVVVLPNPRGSHGFGERFARACVSDWGGGDFEDLMGTVDLLVEERVVDPGRLYVAGYSYGGFMTAWTIGHTQRFRAACISAPVSNLTSMYGTTDIPHFNAYESGGTPWERPEYYIEHSPITHLPKVTTPVQVLHWEGDLRCPIGQGEEIFQGLLALNKEAIMVRYPGGFHVLRTPSQMEDFVNRHLNWFASH